MVFSIIGFYENRFSRGILLNMNNTNIFQNNSKNYFLFSPILKSSKIKLQKLRKKVV